jgi:hypothetical protein
MFGKSLLEEINNHQCRACCESMCVQCSSQRAWIQKDLELTVWQYRNTRQTPDTQWQAMLHDWLQLIEVNGTGMFDPL